MYVKNFFLIPTLLYCFFCNLCCYYLYLFCFRKCYLFFLFPFKVSVYLCIFLHYLIYMYLSYSLSLSLSRFLIPPPPLLHSNCNLIRFALLVFSPSHATFTFTWLAARALASLVIVVPRIFTQSCSAILSPSGRDQHYRLRSPPPSSLPPSNSLMYCNPFIQQPSQEK